MTTTRATGGISGDVLPFEMGQIIPTGLADSNYDLMLGEVFRLKGGGEALLVKANAAVATTALASQRAFMWADTDAFKVTVTTGVTDWTVGISPDSQVPLAAGDYFFLLRGIGLVVNMVDSGAGVTKGDLIQGTAAGAGITDAADARGLTIGEAQATVAASGTIAVKITRNLPGADA